MGIDIKVIIDPFSGAVQGWYCRGHVSEEEFAEALARECVYICGFEIKKIKRLHARHVPVRVGSGRNWWMHLTEKRGRGAFPVTVFLK